MPLARNTAPIGMVPLVMPLAQVIMSGMTPKYSAAKAAPRRPKPVMTSSKISRMPCLSQICAQLLEIALGRHQHAGRAGDRLDDHGGDGRGIVQRDDALELVGELRAPCSGWPREKALAQVMGVRQMIDAGSRLPKSLAVARDAADRDAAETDAVIAALAADEAGARALAADAVIGDGDLERGIDRLRAGIGEEDMVEIAGRQVPRAAPPLEGLGMAHLEGGRVIERQPPGAGPPRRSCGGHGRH